MALTDIFQIVHDMTLFGRNMVSVYHCERANSGEVSSNISDSFQNSVLPALRALQSDDITNNELRIFNLGSPTDFGTHTLSAASGQRAGLNSPSFVAASVRFNTLNRDVRSGQKRFPGMLETDYDDGAISGGVLTLINDIGTALVGNWLASSDSHHVANYVILKRACETEDPVTGKCLEYRLPETDGELVFYQPQSFLANPEVSSQVSRKVF